MANNRNKKDKLTPKQELFCQHYVDIGNASEAYRLAYNCENMKQATVWRNASALLDNNKVAARIKELEEERAEMFRVDRKKVEAVLMGIVELDPSDMYYIDEKTGKPRLKAPSQMPKRMRLALKSIKNKRGEVSYEFNGKTEAARLLASLNGWEAPKKIDVQGGMSVDGAKIMDFGFNDDDKDQD